jgi:hypothetical protein
MLAAESVAFFAPVRRNAFVEMESWTAALMLSRGGAGRGKLSSFLAVDQRVY